MRTMNNFFILSNVSIKTNEGGEVGCFTRRTSVEGEECRGWGTCSVRANPSCISSCTTLTSRTDVAARPPWAPTSGKKNWGRLALNRQVCWYEDRLGFMHSQFGCVGSIVFLGCYRVCRTEPCLAWDNLSIDCCSSKSCWSMHPDATDVDCTLARTYSQPSTAALPATNVTMTSRVWTFESHMCSGDSATFLRTLVRCCTRSFLFRCLHLARSMSSISSSFNWL